MNKIKSLTDVSQTCRPVRDDIFVTADFNRRATLTQQLLLSRRDNTVNAGCRLYETEESDP